MLKVSRPAIAGLTAVLATLTLSACGPKVPKGQVLAVVNGQEITAQDLAAEARARKLKGKVNEAALLQEVVARVLLAQDGHDRKLDKYPGYPADITRLQQSFVVEKVLSTDIKPAAPPTDAQVRDFMAAHPDAFGRRQRFNVEMIRYTPGGASSAIGEPTSLQGAAAKLKSLNIAFDQTKQVLDSAALPPQLTDRLAATPDGQYVQFKQDAIIIGMVIDQRAPVAAPPEQEMAFARQAMIKNATEQQVRAVVDKLRAKAKISYQPGLAPPSDKATANPSAPSLPASPASKT